MRAPLAAPHIGRSIGAKVSEGPQWYNLPVCPRGSLALSHMSRRWLPSLAHTLVYGRRTMSKKMLSTALLFLIGSGFAVFSIWTLVTAGDSDSVVVGILYLIPAIAAFAALVMLPFKTMPDNK